MHDNYHYYSLYTQISIYNMLQMISRNLIYRMDKCSVLICYKRSGNNCVYYINLYSYWLYTYTVAKYNRVTLYCHRYRCTYSYMDMLQCYIYSYYSYNIVVLVSIEYTYTVATSLYYYV